jgi:hypothetical protein
MLSMVYGDLRDQMHPRVAQAVPSSPEAEAILHKRSIKSLTFGDLVTKLVELGTVDANDMDSVRSGVSDTLGIEPDEFDTQLAGGRIIRGEQVRRWSQYYKFRVQTNFQQAKASEFLSHFSDRIMEAGGGTLHQLGMLQPRIEPLNSLVMAQEAEIAEKEAAWGEAAAIPLRLMLEKVHRPKLVALRASRYAISLTGFADLAKTDPVFMQNGEEFAGEIIDELGTELATPQWSLLSEGYPLYEWFNDKQEEIVPAAEAELQNTYLAEPEVGHFAELYAAYYYDSRQGIPSPPGRAELDAIVNPVNEVFYVSDEEKAAFFKTFPLANGIKPPLF